MVSQLMFRFTVFALSAFGLIHPTYSSTLELNGSIIQKDRIRAQIQSTFKLKSALSNRELYSIVQKSINEANPRHQGLSISEINGLSREVVTTAQCYGIEPVVFTGLLWRESNFKPSSQSERGAIGLSQMTLTGIQEVLERLSPTSHRRLGYLRTLVKKCNPQFLVRVPPVASADTLAAWKNSVAFSNTDALVMGALLLKIKLASTNPQKTMSSAVATYQAALELYNGDPKVKAQFAKDVLQLAKRMTELPEVALNDSRFVSQIKGL